jgi:hypothetical protein
MTTAVEIFLLFSQGGDGGDDGGNDVSNDITI